MSEAPRRVCVFGERLAAPPDEGIKKLTLSLAAAARSLGHDVLALTTDAPDWREQDVHSVEADRLLRSDGLAKRLAGFKPDAVFYVPTASLTFASGLRSGTLRRYAGAPVALIATQGRRHGVLVRLAARVARPDLCAAQSAATRAQAERLGWRSLQLPPGVDLAEFKPAAPAEKARLRGQFGLPADAFIAIHAGHLNRNRGVSDLVALADVSLPVLAASTSTAHDEALADELRRGGVTVLTQYMPNIADLYAAADAYVFPVPPNPLDPSSMDMPLSVLEAAACDLPVVTTRFGALPETWPNAAGVTYCEGPAELRAAVARLKGQAAASGGTRQLAASFSWEAVVRCLLEGLLADGGRA
jgi:glycosyltransferase involved in cell wall biosynthesis